MIQVYNTSIEASNTIELQEKIMEEAHTWWKWHTGDGGDRIKSLGVVDFGTGLITIFEKDFPDGNEPISEEGSWKCLVKTIEKGVE